MHVITPVGLQYCVCKHPKTETWISSVKNKTKPKQHQPQCFICQKYVILQIITPFSFFKVFVAYVMKQFCLWWFFWCCASRRTWQKKLCWNSSRLWRATQTPAMCSSTGTRWEKMENYLPTMNQIPVIFFISVAGEFVFSNQETFWGTSSCILNLSDWQNSDDGGGLWGRNMFVSCPFSATHLEFLTFRTDNGPHEGDSISG